MRKKLLMAIALLVSGVGNLWAQENLLEGAIPTVSSDTYYNADSGWKFFKSDGTDKSSDFYNSSKDPKARVRASSSTTKILSDGSPYSGSHFLIRWDGFSNAVYSYPVTLEANKFYTFIMNVVHWNNDNTNIIAGINTNADGRGTVINSVTTESVNSTGNGKNEAELKSFTFNARISTPNTYYVTFKNSSNAIYCIADNISLADADISVYKSNWQTARNNAVEARDNGEYTNVTGNERTNLGTEIAKAEPATKADYFTAMVALENATATFTGAKSAYDYYKGIKDENTAMGADLLAVEPTTAAAATAGGNTLKVNQYNYVSTTYTGDVTDLYVGSWTTKTNFDDATNTQHWSGNSTTYYNKWAGSGTTSTLSQKMSLPAGSYVLKVAGRGTGPELSFTDGSVTKYFQLLGGEGLGITKTGVANYTEAAETYANENKGYGWEWRFIKLTLAEAADVTVTLKITRTSSAGWGSFSDFAVLATPLTASLNRYNLAYSAATAAKANGTYANVLGGSEEADLTEAINADGSLDKSKTDDLDAATLALTTATRNFTNAVTNYDRLAAALAEASSISYDGSSYAVTSTTTSSEALSNANTLYSAMFSSLKTEKPKAGKVIGFEAGEYAPYNNVAILAAWKLADAITTVAEAATSSLDAAITALNGASWASANAEELNAIYDGTLKNAEIKQGETGDNVVLPGWVTKEGNTRQTFKGTDEDGKACLAGADDQVGLFVHPGTYNYGETDGYTMPLKSGVVYVARAKYCSWSDNSNNNFTLKIFKNGVEFIKRDYGANKTACTVEDALKEVQLFFTPDADANYVLSVVINGNTFMTDFYIEKATTATMSVKANKWGTFIAPFDVTIPDGVNAYTVTGISGTTIVKSDALETTIPANTPVILENTTESLISQNFNGKDISSEDSYTVGLLTGVYTAAPIAASDGSNTRYVLQTQEDVQAFYKVTSAFTASPNRCYLTVPVASGVKAFYLDGDETAVSSVKADELQGATIYNLAGQRVSKAQKGVYIINGKKVAVK